MPYSLEFEGIILSGFSKTVIDCSQKLADPNNCCPITPKLSNKPWAYKFDTGTGTDNCDPIIKRRTEKGWTLDFIFNRENLNWSFGGVFYYLGVRGDNDPNNYADNNLSFQFTSDRKIKWVANHYSGYCATDLGYQEVFYTASGLTPSICATDETKDFNVTITFDRYKHYTDCDIENDGGWNDLLPGPHLIPYTPTDTGVTSTHISTGYYLTNSTGSTLSGETEVYQYTEELNKKWANERQRRLGTLKIYLNGRPIYKLEDWEEVIPSSRGVQPFIQSWGGGTGLMNNIHSGVCCFNMKSIKYYEEPLDFVHVRHNFLTRLNDYDFFICGGPCDDEISGFVPNPTPSSTTTPTPTPTHTASGTPTPTPTLTSSNTPTPTHTASGTPTPTPTLTSSSTPTPTPTATQNFVSFNLDIEVSSGSIIVDFIANSSQILQQDVDISVIASLNLINSDILDVESTITILSGETSGVTRVEITGRTFDELDLTGNLSVGQIILNGYEYEVFANLNFINPTSTPTPTPTLTSSNTPTPTPTIQYYYYFLIDCEHTHNKIGRSSSPGLGGIIYSNGENVCYEIIGADPGLSYDYDLDSLVIVNNCSDVLCSIPRPNNDLTYVIIPNNNLVYTIIPNNDLTYKLIPNNDLTYITIPNSDISYVIIPNNDLTNTLIPNNDLTNTLIPNNDLEYLVLPLNDVNYTLIPNPDSTYTLIPNNDVEYSVLKPPTVFYGQIKLGEDSVEGTCNCPVGECPRFYVTGDGPTFCESNIFVSNGFIGINGWGTIVYDGYYKTINMDGTNIATYRTDCGTCPTPTPTLTPTQTLTPTPTSTTLPVIKIVDLNINTTESYPGSGSTITDLLGNTNASLMNSPTYQNDGCTSSIALNGSNQYILTNTNISSQYNSSSTSVFLWVYITDNGVILDELGQQGIMTGWHDVQIEVYSGTLKMDVWPYGGTISSAITFNNWHYSGFTYDGTYLTGYIDGYSFGSSTITRLAPYQAGNGLFYAIGDGTTTNLGDGSYSALKFSRLEVWNGAITSNSVLENYNNAVNQFICLTPTPTLTLSSTPTPTPTSTTSEIYYYIVNGYGCGTPCYYVGQFIVKSPIPLTIGYFYNNPENRGYTFEILSLTPAQSTNYDLTGEPGYSDCVVACYGPTPTPTLTETPTLTLTETPTPTLTSSSTSTPTPTPTLTSSSTSTPTPTLTSSSTSTPTPTQTVTATRTSTPTPTLTSSSTPTPTPTSTLILSAPTSVDPTLQIWYDATDLTTFQPGSSDGQAITQWNDKAAIAHNASPIGSSSTRPKVTYNVQNGKSALFFDQNDDGLEANMSTNLQSLTGATFIMVSKIIDTSSVPQQLLLGGTRSGGSFSSSNNFDFSITGVAGYPYRIGMGSGVILSDMPKDTNFHIHTVTYNGTASYGNKVKHRVDSTERGLLVSSEPGSTTSATLNAIIVGVNSALGNDLYGYIGELLIYTRTLTQTEITNTENYLKQKWGIV